MTRSAGLAGRRGNAWRSLLLGALSLAGVLLAVPAFADAPGRVGRLAEMRGDVWMLDGEQREWVQAQRNRPLTTGDRVSTDRNASAEVNIGSGTLRIGSNSEIDLVEVDDDAVRIEVLRGSVALRLRAPEFAREFQLLGAEGRMQPLREGHYRFDRGQDSTLVGVWSGSVRFEARDSALELHDGQRAEFWREDGRTHYSWIQPQNDDFAEWALAQAREEDRFLASRPYVSPEMTGAYELDRYGRWDRNPEYGVIWYPTTVSVGWAPYRYGRWAWVQPWGWTWVDDAPWGFAPFHYGRWAYIGSRWGWVPGAYAARPVYAPALVAWVGSGNVSIGISVGAGSPYVGWVPLAPRELYVPSYPVAPRHWRYVNPWHERNAKPVPTQPIMYTNRGVPGGVTVVPSDVLRERQPISANVVSRVDPRVIRQVAEAPRVSAPPPRAVLVPGGAVPAQPGRPGVQSRPGGYDGDTSRGRVVRPGDRPAGSEQDSTPAQRVRPTPRVLPGDRAPGTERGEEGTPVVPAPGQAQRGQGVVPPARAQPAPRVLPGDRAPGTERGEEGTPVVPAPGQAQRGQGVVPAPGQAQRGQGGTPAGRAQQPAPRVLPGDRAPGTERGEEGTPVVPAPGQDQRGQGAAHGRAQAAAPAQRPQPIPAPHPPQGRPQAPEQAQGPGPQRAGPPGPVVVAPGTAPAPRGQDVRPDRGNGRQDQADNRGPESRGNARERQGNQ